MKRFWVILTVATGLAILSPAFSQEAEEATEESTISPGEEPAGEDVTTTDTTTTTTTESSMGAAMWRDEAGNLYANSEQKFALNARDNLSQIDYTEYKVDDSAFRRYQGPITIEDEGAHTIVYRSIDKAGNQEVDRLYNVTIDNTPPIVTVVPSRPFVERDGRTYTSPGNTFTIRAKDSYSGVKAVQYSVNSAQMEAYDENKSVQLVESGSQLIRYSAEDNLGNMTSDGSVTVEVDGVAPTVEIRPTKPLIHVGDVKYASRNTGFNVVGRDQGSGVSQLMIRIDDSQEWQTYSGTIYFTTERVHSIEARAVDAVGNESEVVRSDFTVDDNPPATTLEPVN